MKIHQLLALLFLSGTLFTNPLRLSGAENYILFSPACMERLEYAYSFTPQNMYYVKYHVRVSPTEVLVLEVAPEENAQRQAYLNGPALGCDATDILNKELPDKILTQSMKLFVVRREGDQYIISPVNSANYFRRDDRGVVYESWQFSFDHQGSLSPGVNLTKGSPQGVNIVYEGPTKYECANGFLFKQTFNYQPDAYRELFFVPGLGIVEERPNTGKKDSYRLVRVNGEPVETYLPKLCSGQAAASADFLTAPGTGSAAAPAAATPSPAYGTSTGGTATGPQYHIVEPGETLYSLSRSYNVSVEQLRQWNNFGPSALLKIGDRVQVSGAAAPTPVTAYNYSAQPASSSPPAANGSLPAGGSTLPASGTTTYGSSTPAGAVAAGAATASSYAANPSASTTTARGGSRFAWQNTDGWHTVKAGETVALLALNYGYTEARFRDMNNLGANDVVMVGQKVKTTDCAPAASATDMTPRSVTPYTAAPTPQNATAPAAAGSLPSSANPQPAASGTLPAAAAAATLPAGQPATGVPQPQASSATHFEPYSQSSPDFGQPITPAASPAPAPAVNNTGVPPAANPSGTATQPAAPTQPAPAANPNDGFGTPLLNSSATPPPAATQPAARADLFGPAAATATLNYNYNPSGAAATSPQTSGAAVPTSGGQPAGTAAATSGSGATLPTGGSTLPASGTPAANSGTLPGTTGSAGQPNSNPTAAQPSYYNTNPSATTPVNPASTTPANANSYRTVHIVREGESLDSVARRYNTTTDQLQRLNNLQPNEMLIPYQKLYVN